MSLKQMIETLYTEKKTYVVTSEDKIIVKEDEVSPLLDQITNKLDHDDSDGILDLLWQLFQHTKKDQTITPNALKNFFQRISPIADQVIKDGEVAIKNLLITYFQTLPSGESDLSTLEKSMMRLYFAEGNMNKAIAKCRELFLENPLDREMCAIFEKYMTTNLSADQLKEVIEMVAISKNAVTKQQ